ncbi:winged helix-turn-helix transcriptional regulator [Actinomadura oligospora]|uniref:winged helix-turn-helix transcriptional regulator n=1 Tax=Actinomadura oligospora TaxID=111804 RepID=UPI000479D143|nr:winged helix-turn-helix transcriptional regulator [Actinomadura oligospora]
MRTYGQYCSIARALDVLGDRWTLLIVRELFLRGACRFTDLRSGLPGIATNLLSGRLKELEDAGLVGREDAPPPVATALYVLTEDGRALEPVLKALGMWGLRFMADERPGDAFQASWLAYASSWFLVAPDAPPVTVQLRAGGEEAVIEVGGGEVHARVGRADDPDLTLDGPPRAVLGLLTGQIDVTAATALGLTTTGDRAVLARLRRPGGDPE